MAKLGVADQGFGSLVELFVACGLALVLLAPGVGKAHQQSSEFRVQISENQLFLHGSISELETEMQSLRELRQSFGEFSNCVAPIHCEGSQCEVNASACVPRVLRQLHGQTIPSPGPNCFGTVFFLRGFLPGFRGVGTSEFESFIKAHCYEVESPQAGDIGVFERPGFGALHAYLYVSPHVAFEKPGVDTVLGKTPMSLVPLSSVMYRHWASPECRRWAKDPSECANRHFYLRCDQGPQNLFGTLERDAHAIEEQLVRLVSRPGILEEDQKTVLALRAQLQRLESQINSNSVSDARVLGRVRSFWDQLRYLEIQLKM